ncbi:DUF3465 domain-containing protein [Congregibacter sp.]|uniref:DUF3465 domain-containing protein n=1 Tax=Congregibacter sp. TaxID=2744308 RepID=UPI00385A6605
MKKKQSLPLVIGLALATWLWNEYGAATFSDAPSTSAANSDAVIEAAFENRQSDLQVRGSGTVVHVLPDDTKGSQHQKFLLELDSGLTLLVAHNIDLAPRIPRLQKGDRVGFNGEYEWTEKGGVMHWTHHDPRGRHEDGWLERDGERFE